MVLSRKSVAAKLCNPSVTLSSSMKVTASMRSGNWSFFFTQILNNCVFKEFSKNYQTRHANWE